MNIYNVKWHPYKSMIKYVFKEYANVFKCYKDYMFAIRQNGKKCAECMYQNNVGVLEVYMYIFLIIDFLDICLFKINRKLYLLVLEYL